MSTLASTRSYPAVFHCPSCGNKCQTTSQHESGYCYGCMRRSRNFWLDRWSLEEIDEVANMLWPEDFVREEVAA